MPDYEAMSGADFMRAVGDDPEKWAEAFMQRHAPFKAVPTREEQVAYLAKWFGDAMDAARKNPIRDVIEGDSA
jgi:hypothetical protein